MLGDTKGGQENQRFGMGKYGPCRVGTPKHHMWPLKGFKQKNDSDIIKSDSETTVGFLFGKQTVWRRLGVEAGKAVRKPLFITLTQGGDACLPWESIVEEAREGEIWADKMER